MWLITHLFSIWHLLYLKYSGSVKLIVMELSGCLYQKWKAACQWTDSKVLFLVPSVLWSGVVDGRVGERKNNADTAPGSFLLGFYVQPVCHSLQDVISSYLLGGRQSSLSVCQRSSPSDWFSVHLSDCQVTFLCWISIWFDPNLKHAGTVIARYYRVGSQPIPKRCSDSQKTVTFGLGHVHRCEASDCSCFWSKASCMDVDLGTEPVAPKWGLNPHP